MRRAYDSIKPLGFWKPRKSKQAFSFLICKLQGGRGLCLNVPGVCSGDTPLENDTKVNALLSDPEPEHTDFRIPPGPLKCQF